MVDNNNDLINFENIDEKLRMFFTFVGIKLFIFFNFLKTHFEINYNWLYETNETFHRAMDTFENGLHSFKKISVPYYIEPPFSYFKICYKDETYKEEYLNSDSLLYNTETKDILNAVVNIYKDFFNIVKPLIKKNELDYLVLIHYKNVTDDLIISRVIENKSHEDVEYNDIYNVEKTRNFFLSIEYSHPQMKNTIPITIDPKYLVTGNELFSPCFIFKCLNYQSEPYVFDTNYKVNILDSNIKNVVITSEKYVRLSLKTYEILTIHSETSNKKDD